MEPTTEREAIIRMESNMESIAKTMEKISESLTRLEDFKLKEIESRITLIERKMYIAIGIIMAFEFIVKFYTHTK